MELQIEQKILNPKQIAFLEWLVSPIEERKFATQIELAAHLGVSQQTLSTWKNLPEIRRARWAATLGWADDKVSKVINKLVQYALQPNGTKDRETFVKHVVPMINTGHINQEFDVLQP